MTDHYRPRLKCILRLNRQNVWACTRCGREWNVLHPGAGCEPYCEAMSEPKEQQKGEAND